jgi:hypothetical protein
VVTADPARLRAALSTGLTRPTAAVVSLAVRP